jgi:hypothetical protein
MDMKLLKSFPLLNAWSMLLLISACRLQPDKIPALYSDSAQSSLIVTESKEFCFRKISGIQNRDTLEMSFRITGKSIQGELRQAIFEKDQRIGPISGEWNGRLFRVAWFYQQEGIRDTLPVQFLITPAGVLMAPLGEGEKTGGQAANIDTGNWITIQQVSCYQR